MYTILPQVFHDVARECIEPFRSCFSKGATFRHFVNFVLSGAEAGTGFILAAFILTAAYRKLNSAKVPASFRGFPAMLVYLGLISMAVYALR